MGLFIFIGVAIVIVMYFSFRMIERTLKSLEHQNERVIQLLEDIKKNTQNR